MWYVIQVQKDRERQMAELVGRVAPAGTLDECFCPSYATEIKLHGSWTPTTRVLFPGYIIAVTSRPELLMQSLAALPEFGRLLCMDGAPVALAPDEVELLEGLTRRGSRTVEMSRAHKEGERVVVTEGPLVGREGLIERVDRHKSTATLRVRFCGRSVSVRVGLAVLSAPEEPEAKLAALYAQGGLRDAS